MFLVKLRSIYQQKVSMCCTIWHPNSDKKFNMRKPIQLKPIVITMCRHCSWKPNDDSQLSHFGCPSDLHMLKRQTSRRWLATYHKKSQMMIARCCIMNVNQASRWLMSVVQKITSHITVVCHLLALTWGTAQNHWLKNNISEYITFWMAISSAQSKQWDEFNG